MTRLQWLVVASLVNLVSSVFGQQVASEGKRDVDTIYVLDVSGSMVEDLNLAIEAKTGLFSSFTKSKSTRVQEFLADSANAEVIAKNRLQRYIDFLVKEIDAHDRGHVSLMLFANGPVNFKGYPPNCFVEIYCTCTNDPKKAEVKSVLDPVKYGRFPATEEPYRGVLVEAILGNKGPTFINKTCLKAMDLFKMRSEQPDYKMKTRMQRLLLYTDGQELERMSTLGQVISRFKLAQREMDGGFQFVEEYAGDVPDNEESKRVQDELAKNGFDRHSVQRIVVNKVFATETETPWQGEVAKYDVKFTNIKPDTKPTLTIRCSSVPADLIQLPSGDGHTLEIPYADEGVVPSFTLSAHATPGIEKGTATLDFSVNDEKFVFSTPQITQDFIFIKQPLVSIVRAGGEKTGVKPGDKVSDFSVFFENIKEGTEPALNVVCTSDPAGCLQLAEGGGVKQVVPYAGKGQKGSFSLIAKEYPGEGRGGNAKATLELSANDAAMKVEPKQIVVECTFVPPPPPPIPPVVIEWFTSDDKLVSSPAKVDFGRGVLLPRPRLQSAAGGVAKFRLVTSDRFRDVGAKLQVKVEGDIAEAIQFLPVPGLPSISFSASETTMVGWEVRRSAKPGTYEGAITVSCDNNEVVFKDYGPRVRVPLKLEVLLADLRLTAKGLDAPPNKLDFGKVKQHHVAQNTVTNRPAGDAFTVDAGGATSAEGLYSIALEGSGSKAFYVTNLDEGNETNRVDGLRSAGGKYRVKLDPALMYVAPEGAGKAAQSSQKGVFEATLIIKPRGKDVLLNERSDEFDVELRTYILDVLEAK